MPSSSSGFCRCVAPEIVRAPRAAAVATQLLRTLGRPTPESARCQLESICYGLLQASADMKRGCRACCGGNRRPREGSASSGAIRCYTGARTGAGPKRHHRPMRDQLFEAFDTRCARSADTRIKMLAVGPRSASAAISKSLVRLATRDGAPDPQPTLPALPGGPPRILDVHVQGACVGAGLRDRRFCRSADTYTRCLVSSPGARHGLIPGAADAFSAAPDRTTAAALMILSAGASMRATACAGV